MQTEDMQMDEEKEEDAALDFLSKNIGTLSKNEYVESEFIAKKTNYIRSRPLMKFSNKIFATVSIKVYIEAGRFSKKSDLEAFLNNNRFYRENIFSTEREETLNYWDSINLEKGFPIYDIKEALDIINRTRAALQISKKEVLERTQKLKEIEEKVEEKEREYRAVPSILASEVLSEPEEISYHESQIPWWEELGLISDPFISREGITTIPENLLDSVLVKTQLFDMYKNYIRVDTDSIFFKSTILFGQFGSGKTTFFQYLSREMLLTDKIYPIYIILRTERDKFAMRQTFENKIVEKLSEEYKIQKGMYPLFDETKQQISIIKKLMLELSNNKGFVIIIDNLHKGNGSDYNIAMDFLRDLQSFKDELINSGIRIGFLIAGSLDWEPIILKDPSLSGSIERKEHMPPITVGLAKQMINNRLRAFSKNKDKPLEVGDAYISQIYRYLQNEGRPISYRSFIEVVYEELLKRNFSILERTILTDSVRDKIRLEYESDSILKIRFAKFLFGAPRNYGLGHKGIQKLEHREKGLQFLIYTFLEKQIKDDSDIIKNNKFYFQRLYDSDLINKVKIKNDLYWMVCPEILKINSNILREYNLSLEDYLVQVYTQLQTKKPTLESNTKIKEIKSFLASEFALEKDKDIKDLISESLEMYETISNELSVTTKKLDAHVLKDSWDSFEKMSRALILLEGILPSDQLNTNNIAEIWRNYWQLPEIIDEYLRNFERLNEEDLEKRVTCSRYKEAYDEIFRIIKDLKQKERVLPLVLTGLSKDEINTFYTARNYWFSKDYFEMMVTLNDKTQKKFRKFLHNTFVLLYGEDIERWKERVDNDTWSYIKNNEKKSIFGKPTNIFEELNRGNYKQILTEDNYYAKRNWGEVFQYVLKGMTKTEFGEFLQQFGETLKSTDHGKSTSIIEPSFASSYLIKTIDFYRSINNAYKNLLENGLYQDSTASNVFYFSYSGRKINQYTHKEEPDVSDKGALAQIVPDAQISKLNDSIKRSFDINGEIEIDIEDRDRIKNYNGIPYRIFVFYFAFLLQYDKFKLDFTPTNKLKVKTDLGTTISLVKV